MEGTSMLGRIEWYRERLERAEAELARLTTLRPASEHDGKTVVLWWKSNAYGRIFPECVRREMPRWNYKWWTPLPEPKGAEK